VGDRGYRKCGAPNEKIDVCYENFPYEEKTGLVKVRGRKDVCADSACELSKSRRTWPVIDGTGFGHESLIWVGLVPERPGSSTLR